MDKAFVRLIKGLHSSLEAFLEDLKPEDGAEKSSVPAPAYVQGPPPVPAPAQIPTPGGTPGEFPLTPEQIAQTSKTDLRAYIETYGLADVIDSGPSARVAEIRENLIKYLEGKRGVATPHPITVPQVVAPAPVPAVTPVMMSTPTPAVVPPALAPPVPAPAPVPVVAAVPAPPPMTTPPMDAGTLQGLIAKAVDWVKGACNGPPMNYWTNETVRMATEMTAWFQNEVQKQDAATQQVIANYHKKLGCSGSCVACPYGPGQTPYCYLLLDDSTQHFSVLSAIERDWFFRVHPSPDPTNPNSGQATLAHVPTA